MIRFLNVYFPASIVALLLSELALLASCYLAATAFVLMIDPVVFLLYDSGILRISIVIGTILIGYYFQDMYAKVTHSTVSVLQQLCVAFGFGLIGQALVGYLYPPLILPRAIMMTGTLAALPLMAAWRLVFSAFVSRHNIKERIIFVGDSDLAGELAQKFETSPELSFRCVGVIDHCASQTPAERAPDAPPLLGDVSEIKEIVQRIRPDRLVVSMTERRARLPVNELLELRFAGVFIEHIISLYEGTFGRIPVRALRPSDLVFTGGFGPRASTARLQWILSFLVASIFLVVLSPVLLLVALGVRLTSKGPVLYRQTRVGRDDKPFTIYKFRSMRVDAEVGTGAVWASKNDPRITNFGNFIRKTRLDELPQLFNIFRGEMSLVGPRPERPEFTESLERMIPFYRQRTAVRPGITGWAQINYKYGDTVEDTIIKLEYDLYYIRNMSLLLDLFILVSTVKTVLFQRGAH
jgi:sugar transferase (PEP-CTERM system associated)